MKLEATFCKRGDLRYISHLDIVRLFQRSVRRASLPVSLSQGYSPHYKISFGQALKLGIESENEKAIFSLDKWIEPDEFMNKINEKLPEEVRIVECKKRF
ncbi:MAG: TIGR03936 family radical SAM-associated protein [Candidatus Omnitrophica bacterium]|nr:TIGR03936 family radical SAM-associated protein [Candidatus Omnitrophota bacterium]